MTDPHQQPLFDDLPPHPEELFVCADKQSLVRVAFEAAGDNLYDYAVPPHLQEKMQLGKRVEAPLGRSSKPQIGFCVAFPEKADVKNVKNILAVHDDSPLLTPEMMELAQWIARYYCAPLGATLAAMVPAAVKKQIGMTRRRYLKLIDTSPDLAQTVRLSRQGRLILDFLLKRPNPGEPILIDPILESLNITQAPLKTLAAAGLVSLFEQQEMTLPISPAISPAELPACPIELNSDQRQALDQIHASLERGGFQTMLLHGVTGSGKTEVYIRAIEQVVRQGGQALVLVPEIALTPQIIQRFLERFANVAVLHSGLTASQRNQQWHWIAQGQVQVVVGARSAVFAPLPRLQLIIVDEEHEPSYKQDTQPRYHGRDVAVKRAQLLGIHIILGSATPSLESYCNCRIRNHYQLLQLPCRVNSLPLPKVHIIDMVQEYRERKGTHLFSRTLEGEIHQCISTGHQAIILLNRRGHSSYIFCPSCKYVVTCPNCDVNLTCHKRPADGDTPPRSWVMCHYCLHSSKLPQQCPLCSKKLMLIGPGTQHAEEEIKQKMPDYRTCRVDSDSVKPADYEKILRRFGQGEIDILLGTQMIGKGLDFPKVALVGVLNADTALALPDFRSSERTFQLIAQVAGRCGRAFDHGRVIVQTFLPNDPAITLACQHDYEKFARQELLIRQKCQMPPYSRLARIILRDPSLEKVQHHAQQFRQAIDQTLAALPDPVEVRGPVPAVIATIENYHRMEILLKAASPGPIQSLLTQLRQTKTFPTAVHCVVDVDPFHLL